MSKEKLKTCEGCEGMCCKYVVIEIEVPETLEDFENIKWYVVHKNVNVFIGEDGSWNLEFITPCENLNEQRLCTIYENRPKICREYSQEDCPFHNEYKEIFSLKKIEDVEEYIEKIFKKGLHVISKDNEEDE